jgi:erythronate-4-phosphate dehydrogenase
MKIVADNKIPFLKGVLEPYAEVAYYPGTEINAKLVNDADALLVRTRTKCNANLLENSKVKFIATATIGFDHIDTAYCESKDIRWTNAPGCNSVSVMQYIASALVFLSEKYNFNYSDKTLGVVGGGNVGSKVALLASGLGMKVLLNDPPRERVEGKSKFVSLQKIQENADIITFHVPLNNEGVDKTYHLVDEDFLHGIKPETIIINSSRGEVVSAASLKKALKEKKIKAALLDVWENEPLIDKELLDLVDIGTPHIAGYSADGKAMGTAMSVQALSRFFNFNLNNWLPDNIPQVHNNKIEIDCEELNIQEVINKAVLATYNIENDSTALKKSLKTFEAQRGNYPLRREFHAYEVCLKNDKNNIGQLLSTLGFRIHGRNK